MGQYSAGEGTEVTKEALAQGRMKQPKTIAGERKINLHGNALIAAKSQLDIRTTPPFVFHDPKTLAQWASDQPFRKRVWIPALKAAKVRYRECYQMRHTFASQILIENRNSVWLANHIGHSDREMIRKVYGRWIP
jgi:integrase